jgi:hypothetical protein
MAAPGDTVTLRVPRERAYLPLLRMVLGGIASRQDLSFDDLDDVQLAVDNIVAEDEGTQQALTMTVTVDDDTLTIGLAPLSNRDLRETLRLGQVPPGAEGRCLDVCLLLRSLVDHYELQDLDQDSFAVAMRKRLR